MMSNETDRDAQTAEVQGAGEERKGGVQTGTATASRSSQRSNSAASTTGVVSLAGQQGRAVRGSGKKAVIQTGGKQYLVSEGEELEVELLDPSKNAVFDALLVIDGETAKVGAPFVEGAKVNAEIIEQVVKADKVVAIRYKAKKRVHKRRGHRQ